MPVVKLLFDFGCFFVVALFGVFYAIIVSWNVVVGFGWRPVPQVMTIIMK